jgi:hypothetical protein
MSLEHPRLLRIPERVDLLAALSAAIGEQDGWLEATGHIEDVELGVAGEGANLRRGFHGRFTLASLSGRFGGPYAVTLARASGAGIETVAGMLFAARSAGVTAFCTPALALSVEAAAERPEPKAPTATPEKATPTSADWARTAQAAAVSAANEADDDEEPEEFFPEPGDFVQHFAFGLCEVLRVEGDRLTLRDVKRAGRVREIRVQAMLSVGKPTISDGRRVFSLDRRT